MPFGRPGGHCEPRTARRGAAPRLPARSRRRRRRALASRDADPALHRAGRARRRARVGDVPAAAVLEPARLPALPLEGPRLHHPRQRRRLAALAARHRLAAAVADRLLERDRARARPRARRRRRLAVRLRGAPVLHARARIVLGAAAAHQHRRDRAAGRAWAGTPTSSSARAAGCTSRPPPAGNRTPPSCRPARSRSRASTPTSSHLDYDHCFEGWRGRARIRDERFSLQLASRSCPTSSSTRRPSATTSASSR